MAHSDGFFVDPEALSDAHAGIGRLLGEMEAFTLSADHPASVFGHDELAESAKEFHEQWKHGIAELAGQVAAIHGGLGETIDEYRRADEENAALFDELGDEDGR